MAYLSRRPPGMPRIHPVVEQVLRLLRQRTDDEGSERVGVQEIAVLMGRDPLYRRSLFHVLRRLVARGLVEWHESVEGSSVGWYQISEEGRTMLDTIDNIRRLYP